MSARYQRGFSLIELSIVLVIIGILMAGAMQTYRVSVVDNTYRTTSGALTDSSVAIGNFIGENLRMPCPANPTLPPSDPNFGKEYCPGRNGNPVLAVGSCTGGTTGVCRYTGGTVKINGVDTVVNVLVGGIPFASTGAAEVSQIDGYGNKLKYAVTEILTDTTTYKSTYAGVPVESYNFKTNAFEAARNVAAILISGGKNGKGVYTRQGLVRSPCTGGGFDIRNCDADGTFLSTNGYSLVGNYYDDNVLTRGASAGGYWASNSNGVYSQNVGGNVGIGVNAPTQKLDVMGNVRTIQVQAEGLCDEDGNACFNADIIGGAGIACDDGAAMTGIANGDKICAELEVHLPVGVNSTCPPNQFAYGITTSGTMICR